MTKKVMQTTFGERFLYGLYAFGAILSYYAIYSYLQLYLTDIGISAAAVGVIFIIAKVWDAVNDPMFGVIVDKANLKGGKFIPWLKIGAVAIPLSTILMFLIPSKLPVAVKIIWALVSYIIWDLAYTMYDAPISALATVATDNTNERNKLYAIASFGVYFGGILVAILVPMFYPAIGWSFTIIVLGIICLISMLPLPFKAKERFSAPRDKEPTSKEIIQNLFKNKYLLIVTLSAIIGSVTGFSTTLQGYFAIHCLENAAMMTPLALASAVPILLVVFIVPKVLEKVDKFRVYIITRIASILLSLIIYFCGYQNVGLFLGLVIVRAFIDAFWAQIGIMFIADCVEYGQYKTGERNEGVSFSLKAFTNKMVVALAGAIAMFLLGAIGFVSGDGVTQTVEVVRGIWFLYAFCPVIGAVISVIMMLILYKLRDHEINLIKKVNIGEMSREEAEASFSRKF